MCVCDVTEKGAGTWRDFKVPKLAAQMPQLWPLSNEPTSRWHSSSQTASGWSGGWRRGRYQWSGGLPHFFFPILLGQAWRAELSDFFWAIKLSIHWASWIPPPAAPQTQLWKLRMSLFSHGSSPTIILNIRSSSVHHTPSVASAQSRRLVIYSPIPMPHWCKNDFVSR